LTIINYNKHVINNNTYNNDDSNNSYNYNNNNYEVYSSLRDCFEFFKTGRR